MLSYFGYGFSSPLVVHSILGKQLKKINKRLGVALGPGLCDTDAILFLNLRDFFVYNKLHADQRAVAVIFDSPQRLGDLRGLHLMDCERAERAVFYDPRRTGKADYDILRRCLENPPATAAPITYKPVSAIDSLIALNVEGRFLNFLNAFLYSTPVVRTRAVFKSAVLRYIFGDIAADEFSARVEPFMKRKVSKSRSAYGGLLDYITSSRGRSFLAALSEIERGGVSDYDAIAKKHGVDAYEIRYLHKSYAQLRD